jgi:2-polyprenyl-3-methyl-5-hydroxy-6-metoxy-1,4-benzoquinol methylase
MRDQVAIDVASNLQLNQKHHLLDIGCGDAELAKALTPYTGLITAVDPDHEVLKQSESHPGLRVMQAKAQEVDQILEKQADSVLVYNVCQYWEQAEDALMALAAIFKVLKPGGRLFLGGILGGEEFVTYEGEFKTITGQENNSLNPGKPWQPETVYRLTKQCGFDALPLPYLPDTIKLPYRFDWLCLKPF